MHMGLPRPSEVRERILREHDALQRRLLMLDELAVKADGGNRCAGECAAELSGRLFDELADQLDVEEQLLVPLLREMDAWGEVRIDELARLHDQAWQELKALRERAADDGMTARGLADELARLARALRRDLLVEERDLLAPDVLRDDVLGIDVEDG